MQEKPLTCPLLVKLDVQGYEDRVIQGAGKTLSRATAVLTEVNFEPLYTHQADFDLTYRALVACGFEFRGMWDHTLDETTGLPVFGDALFTRRQPSRGADSDGKLGPTRRCMRCRRFSTGLGIRDPVAADIDP